MSKALYPGSFDPLTLGHLDIIRRAAEIFGEVEVLISGNPDKSGRLSLDEKTKLIKEAISDIPGASVSSYAGLTVDYARDNNCNILIRGLRGSQDLDSELEMSQINNSLTGIDTVFLMTDPKYSFIRATRVWELLLLGADISKLVPSNVASFLAEKNTTRV